jgi:hypothetical protein
MLFVFSVFFSQKWIKNKTIFEEEQSNDSSDNNLFSNELNCPLKNLDLDDDNNNNNNDNNNNNNNDNNNNNIPEENSSIDFSPGDSLKKLKEKDLL